MSITYLVTINCMRICGEGGKKVYPVMYNSQIDGRNTLIDLIFYWLIIYSCAIILMYVVLVHYIVSRYKHCTFGYINKIIECQNTIVSQLLKKGIKNTRLLCVCKL